jgi:hypothetical protein
VLKEHDCYCHRYKTKQKGFSAQMLQAFSRKPKSFKVGLKSSLKIVVHKTTIMGLQSKLRNGLSDKFDEEIST